MSQTDVLTGLPNRRALMEFTQGLGSTTMVLCVVDIDWIKRVNDTYGHIAGDAVIKAVADKLSATMQDVATLARWGGEEFAALAPADRTEQLVACIEQFRAMVEATPVQLDLHSVAVTISAGWAVRHEAEPFERLYCKADKALYQTKEGGRNRVEAFVA